MIAGLVSYLGRHGIETQHSDVHCSGIPIGKALGISAMDHGAGMLVIGAFGHGRVREFILRGATKSVLDQTMPTIFLSH